MDESGFSFRQQQEKVNAHFQAEASYWKDIYARKTIYAELYRARLATTLAWIDDLVLAPGSRVLEVGCGAGFLSVELAKRGLRVYAIDSAETMVELTRQHAEESGVTELLSVGIGDVYDLGFEDGSFDLVVALGVIPWLERPELAIREMARVSMPGGHVLLTDGNRMALSLLLDPWNTAALAPLGRSVKINGRGDRSDNFLRVGAIAPSIQISHALRDSVPDVDTHAPFQCLRDEIAEVIVARPAVHPWANDDDFFPGLS